MLALRHPPAVLRVRRKLIPLQDDHLVEVLREHSGRAQSRHATAEYHGRPAPHPYPPPLIHTNVG
ncbi:hypothetical protein GCM10009546_32330 [Actinomadura livida]|uniref:Uncharacterized protein n=1 Tax=Actinomadura livida TaxID=79909 RepID=A0ABP3PKD7_9ACTN